MSSTTSRRLKFKFKRSMSTQELVQWLRDKGLASKDCELLQEERFTAESFLLLNKSTYKDLGIGIGGQLLLDKLIEEAKVESMDMDDSDPPAKDSDPPTSTSPPVDETPDEMRVPDSPDRGTFKLPLYILPLCTGPPYDILFSDKEVQQSGAAAALIVKSKVWEGRQVLRVYFMNPKVLEGWKCEGKKMTTDMIMEWAGAWEQAPSAPQFEVTPKVDKADVRVKFSDKEGCWSLVGMEAAGKTKASEPTLMLNLSLKDAPKSFLRYLVIHEFGHALGLEHEHQRSDFWDTVKEFLDQEKMESDERFGQYKSKKGRAAFGRDWLAAEDKGDSLSSDYDPQSIMHYWFSVDWLKKRDYHTRKGVTSDSKLSDKQKKYLLGIHTRNNNCARDPSPSDIRILQAAYGGDVAK